jgi:hypothetical protein
VTFLWQNETVNYRVGEILTEPEEWSSDGTMKSPGVRVISEGTVMDDMSAGL